MTSYDYNFYHQLERVHFLKTETPFRYIEIRNFRVRLRTRASVYLCETNNVR